MIREHYLKKVDSTLDWLVKSTQPKGGSSACYVPFMGWSGAYPETTGYIIPTLAEYDAIFPSKGLANVAKLLGEWLLDIQQEGGFWLSGVEGTSGRQPSIFNTAQIIIGLVYLFQSTEDERYYNAVDRASKWLASVFNDDGTAELGNYKKDFNPSYYTRVAWPMLMACKLTGNVHCKMKAVAILDAIKQKINSVGYIEQAGFEKDAPAFTHTIAYTIRGFIESAILLDDWDAYGEIMFTALERLRKKAELTNGRLASTYDSKWLGSNKQSCLTGNVQVAICMMKYHQTNPNLQMLNAATKLVDFTINKQSGFLFSNNLPKMKGAVAGSYPFNGKYMRFRYPNWAAKFLCDAVLLLIESAELVHEPG